MSSRLAFAGAAAPRRASVLAAGLASRGLFAAPRRDRWYYHQRKAAPPPPDRPNRVRLHSLIDLHADPKLFKEMEEARDKGEAPWLDFVNRHIGPRQEDIAEMLKALGPGAETIDSFVNQVIPDDIMLPPKVPIQSIKFTEYNIFQEYQRYQKVNRPMLWLNGGGYYPVDTPPVIKRNLLENPGWYTSYTPYQAEVSQGRLESLLNFQTMVSDLTGLPVVNASLLDEGPAAAEAMTMSLAVLPSARAKRPGKTYVVSDLIHEASYMVMLGRATGFDINVTLMDLSAPDIHQQIRDLGDDLVGVLAQYPDTEGGVSDFRELANVVHEQGALFSVATDLLALTVLTPPGEWGADIAFGNSQRFGVPMGNGGPHAAFMSVKDSIKRRLPGRLVGVSKDRTGGRALRLALQTREQHIRREKATSNVCTAQALLANMAAMYAVYHGPAQLKQMAFAGIRYARMLQDAAQHYGLRVTTRTLDPAGRVLSDTISIRFPEDKPVTILRSRLESVGVSSGRTWSNCPNVVLAVPSILLQKQFMRIVWAFKEVAAKNVTDDYNEVSRRCWTENMAQSQEQLLGAMPDAVRRQSSYLTHPVFNSHHSETELLRYMHHLQSKDLSLVHSMIPLGSCTMKLNGTAQMELIGLRSANVHPRGPRDLAKGYAALVSSLSSQLAALTGMHATSLQPNSGAQGEFAGLRIIRQYHEDQQDQKDHGDQEDHGDGDGMKRDGKKRDGKKRDGMKRDGVHRRRDALKRVAMKRDGVQRDICLIPVSAHGTNPASASMAGMRVVPIKCDSQTGNLDLEDLEAKCKEHREQLGAIMVTYPSTFGVFEPNIRKVCDMVHEYGGLVYMDGANMNAQIGLTSPGALGADVCHLNLHKTFCIPHGGGGPGVGPVCVKEFLEEYLPHKLGQMPVTSAHSGSASILPISWAYIMTMTDDGLRKATQVALLNANYLLARLKDHYPILYTNDQGRCAHEFILDARPFKASSGIEAVDIAKRLQDYGFHAPTMSWPVPNTLMIEPTESESKAELDRYVDALISIRQEIRDIEQGKQPREGNVLKNAPHSQADLILGDGDGKWNRPYTREQAAYPLSYLREKKFWPTVTRVDDTYGDTNLFCTCPPVEDTTDL
ncbi:Glycine cleavage system P protein [Ophiocordyceps sinensis CO18]|uniref:glycine dehydrogenase (aminomethyl-transferring) n=1 Tax=Ophiocordyceps sinensis (strain Co18 / CGMCC 3.14243) TaxID=911162 RepID=T5A6S0_OPHSC|nr:Glycine cleavage system P protein [Ophiocordyceps sinensis CO18]